MAYITKATGVPCYECNQQCIDGLTQNIRVSITANPAFWGFGGVLISGWAKYSASYFDFFDNLDEDHLAVVPCRSDEGYYSSLLEYTDAQRPDIMYRSVYDPDTSKTVHYGTSGELDGSGTLGIGGAEVYLINRPTGLVSTGINSEPFTGMDGDECTDPPMQVFGVMPDNYGWGNKILFNRSVYKNYTGAWRLSSVENCYDNSIDSSLNLFTPSGYLMQCDGNYKQNIEDAHRRYENFDSTVVKGSGISDYYEYDDVCIPDGGTAKKYKGRFYPTSSITRTQDFIEANLRYGSAGASGLKNGMSLGFKNTVSGQFDNVYRIFDVTHYSNYTNVKLVGTSTGNRPLDNLIPTGNFSLNIPELYGHWVAFETYDPQSCCGLAAYGVSETHKKVVPGSNYHSDFRRVFNNPKNIRQSNRDRAWREDYGLFDQPIQFLNATSGERVDWTYPSVSGVDVSGNIIAYPIIMSGGTTPVVATGDSYISGHPLFERELSYYGNFAETDKYDNYKRSSQSPQRGIGKNATCYTKKATLEVFNETVVQYDKYENCDGQEAYATNEIGRYRFVYRGCDFHDECSFDSEGRPLKAWENNSNPGYPENINDLRRMLAGQEVHIFVNSTSAWGGRVPGTTPCDCEGGGGNGTLEPRHVTVHSPITYPGFVNFDLDPSGYGCDDPRHQISQIINRGLLNTPETAGFPSEYCDPLTTCEDIFGFNAACLPRQPYPTYGYIANLCGNEKNNRKNVIKKAFEKLHQNKTLTNLNPTEIDPETGDILEEPMYWNVVAPTPAPYAGNGVWGSGTTDGNGDGYGSSFKQIAGNGYGFWGLADGNNQLVAPYFTTQNGEFISCDTVHTNYVDFSVTGTFRNVLGTSNGWPTNSMPFLVEIETIDGCNACAVTQMEKQNLHLSIEGLSAEFRSPEGDGLNRNLYKAGHVHCKYGKTTLDVVGGGKVYMGVPPTFTCANGFDVTTCSGTIDGADSIWLAHTGNTCECANNFECTLYPIPLSGTTDKVLGWTSNPSGNAAGLVEISGCGDDYSSYFNAQYDAKGHGGYKIFAEFNLSCSNMQVFLTTAEYPDAKYEGDTLTALYGSTCSHHYPAQVKKDLELWVNLYMVSIPHEDTFRRLSEFALKRIAGMNLGNGIMYPPDELNFYGSQENNYFGTCSGDYIYTYGCKPEGTWFYGCQDDDGRYNNYAACEDTTPCNTCPTGDGPGQVGCICGEAYGYEGTYPSPVPITYQLNECDCLCTTPHLIGIYTMNAPTSAENIGMTLVSGDSAECATVYYMSTLGSPPIPIVQDTIYPYMGAVLGGGNTQDYFDWSHGVNGVVTGINHLVYPPYLGREQLITQTECPQLTIDIGIEGHVPTCEDNDDCTLDTSYGTRTCGPKIYANLGNNGAIPVRKRKCHPEVATVNKIACFGSNRDLYRLHISREYHEHDRTWSTQEAFEIPGSDPPEYEYRCVAVNAGGYMYNDGSVSGCLVLPYSVLSDTVTPVTNAPCSIHPSSGVHVNQDYSYEPSISGQSMLSGMPPPGLELPSGDYVWNYFNLFYKDTFLPSVANGYLTKSLGLLSGYYQCDTNEYPPEYVIQNASGKTVFTQSEYLNPSSTKGIFATNQKHSCVQDALQCGGDLWCNKLFFPRHAYKAGTRVARFGVSQICTVNNTPEYFNILDGYKESVGTNRVDYIDTGAELLKEASRRFVDWCNDENVAFLQYDVGIDQDYIYVNDYLPLIGVTHPGWRYTSDTKSCTIYASGCIGELPLHTNESIAFGAHSPKTWASNRFESMGYYLDSYGVSYSGQENGNPVYRSANSGDYCLINPFKIMIDVECSTNRIRRKSFRNDPPTHIQGTIDWDSRACLGIYGSQNCECGGTMCKYATTPFEGECKKFDLMEYEVTLGTTPSGDPCVASETTVGEWYHTSLVSAYSTGTLVFCSDPLVEYTQPLYTTSCSSKLYRSANLIGSHVKVWQCTEYQYMYEHPNDFDIYPTEVCDCEGGDGIVQGLCNARYRCEDYTSCDCNPVQAPTPVLYTRPAGEGSGQWWRTDCGCDDYPQDDYGGSNFCENSILKWTVTEE
jgi:hypothetical protein